MPVKFLLLFLLLLSPLSSARTVSVHVAPVIQERIVDKVLVLGTAQANESIYVTSKLTDIVTRIYFKEGQWVKKGQRLLQLDDAEQQALLQEAEVNLAEQQREYKRLTTLVKQKAIPSSQLDVQRSQLKTAKAKVKTAEVYIAERLITAPFSGKLGLRDVSVGTLLHAGDVVTTLDDLQQIKLDFSVPDIYLSHLKQGMRITATTKAYPQKKFSGKVATIDSRVDTVSRMIKLRALLPNPSTLLRSGMRLNVTIHLNPRQALMIPERALVPIGSQQFVYVITAQSTAERRLIEIGQRQVGQVEVITGLSLHENVVVEGTLRLKPNSPVKIIDSNPD